MSDAAAETAARPAVSVVMAAHDAEAFVAAAITSLLAQTLPDFEVIVVDDASRDGTAAIVESFHDPRVSLVRLPRNVGAAAARNVALRRAAAPLAAILDADDVSWPHRLEAQVAFLEEHPEVDLVGGQIRVIDAAGTVIGRRTYPRDHTTIMRRLPRWNPLAHSTVTARTAVLLAAGGYDEALTATHDYALWCELAHRGAVLANLEAPLADYRVHRHTIKRQMTRESLLNTLEVQERYWPDPPSPGDRALRLAERLFLALPAGMVNAAFVLLRYRLPEAAAGLRSRRRGRRSA